MRRRPPEVEVPLLDNVGWWSHAGFLLGRCNLPRTPDDDHPLRARLRAAHLDEAGLVRHRYIDDTERIDEVRLRLRQQQADAPAVHTGDPYAAQHANKLTSDIARAAVRRARRHELFCTELDQVTGRAQTCDNAWRLSNQHHRDRRLEIASTVLELPASMYDPIPDPWA